MSTELSFVPTPPNLPTLDTGPSGAGPSKLSVSRKSPHVLKHGSSGV